MKEMLRMLCRKCKEKTSEVSNCQLNGAKKVESTIRSQAQDRYRIEIVVYMIDIIDEGGGMTQGHHQIAIIVEKEGITLGNAEERRDQEAGQDHTSNKDQDINI